MSRSIFFLVLHLNCFASSSDIDYNDWSVARNVLYPTLPIAAPWSKNEKCKNDSRLLIAHLKNKTYWAVQMWDASVKADLGTLHGHTIQVGQIEECMQVKEPIQARYCSVRIRVYINNSYDYGDPYDLDPDPYSIVWKKFKDSRLDPSKVNRDNISMGMCVPASCSREDLNENFDQYAQMINSKSGPNDRKYVIRIPDERYCTQRPEETYSWSKILFWMSNGLNMLSGIFYYATATAITFCLLYRIVTASLVGISIIATFYDLGKGKEETLKESKTRKLLMSFSFNRNLGQLTDIKDVKSQPTQLQILHFFKSLSVIFIVFGHRTLLTVYSPLLNYQTYEAISRTANNMFLYHTDLLVDTFFFLSGLLSCYVLLEIYRKKFVNPLIVVLGRWIRLAPLYYFLVWFHAVGLSKWGTDPLWNVGIESEVEKCKKNWWLNLLFLHNYVRVEDSCMVHTWYISCDFHLFIICIALVILMSRNEKLGVTVLGILTLITTVIPGVITYLYRLTPLLLFYRDYLEEIRVSDTWKLLYIPTHARAAAYFIGMITGYIIFKAKTSNKKLPRNCGTPLLILALGLIFSPMVYGSLYYDPRRPYNVIESSLFATFRRFFWALGCFVTMMVNIFDKNVFLIYASRIKYYLILPKLILSKLSYSIYLVHFYMQAVSLASLRFAKYFSSYNLLLSGAGDLLTATVLAAGVYLFVELPFKKFFTELLFAKAIARTKNEIIEKVKQTELNSVNGVNGVNGSCNLNLGTENMTTIRL